MIKMEPHGLYKVKDEYFHTFRGHWSDNKMENRPYYYLFQDNSGIYWLIPMSTQVDNYKEKIKREESKRGKGNCIYYCIGRAAARDQVFLISDMLPILPEYIKAPFTISSVPYVVQNEALNNAVRKKAMRYLRLVEQGVIRNRNNILKIKYILCNK